MTRIDERSASIELGPERLDRLARALDRDGVAAALIFGSQASGRTTPLSDLDLGVWLAAGAEGGLEMRIELTTAAVGALGSDEVDLVVLNEASPLFRHRAISNRRLLLDREPAQRIRLEARALLDYLDTAPLRAELAAGLEHRLAEDRFGRP